MAEVELMNLTKICQSFPELEDPQIKRENIINTIDDTMFNSGIRLVAVEGNEGIGRTTLLAQFALTHSDCVISLFLRPESHWGYDLKMVEVDLCNQIHWIVNEDEIKTFEEVDDGLMRRLLFQLQRNARKKHRLYYFVVDGLDDICTTDHQVREAILDMLPWNIPEFKFLLSCELTGLPKRICQNVKCKPHILTPVTFAETIQYFGDFTISEESVREIHRICFGIPSRMASVRRILGSGTNVADLLTEATTRTAELFEIEWRSVRMEDRNQVLLLSTIAYSQRRHSINDLSRILDQSLKEILSQIEQLRFVCADGEKNEITWISEGFRKFARTKLISMKDVVTDLIIKDLQRAPESEAALLYLPGYLKDAGRLEELLQYFSPETLARMIETTQSLRPLQRAAEIGIEAALRLQRHGDLMSFSIYKSAVAELDANDIWHSEITALMKLRKYDEAVALAQSAQLHEDRLNLLAIIARIRREQGLDVEKELIEQIHNLYGQIEPAMMGRDRAIGIASNLVFILPDLAIDLVEKAASAAPGENALDWAFALLSLPALVASQTQPYPSNAMETIRSKIKVSTASLFSVEYSLLLGEFSADDAIREAEKLESASDRIYMLRMWAISNRQQDDAVSVVEYGLRLAIKTAAFVPNATVFRELSSPLPFVKDHDKLKHLVGILDSQREIIERAGPTEDYVRLQLLLTKAESTYDFEAARNRLIDVYLTVSELKQDLVIKTDCMAYLLAALNEVDPQKTFEVRDQIHALVEGEVQSNIDTLLKVSADHYEVVKGIVRALSKVRITDLLTLIRTINTQWRRDKLLILLVESAIKAPMEKIDFLAMENVIAEFKNPQNRDAAIAKIIGRLYREPTKIGVNVDPALRIIGQVKDISSAKGRCKASCHAYAFLSKCDNNKYVGMLSHLLLELGKAWESIDDGWLKVNMGFRIADYLSECAPVIANKYLELSVIHRETILLDNRNAGSAYLACLRLATRTYGGLLPMNLDSKEDLDDLAHLIGMLPSNGERVLLWADLALILHIHRRYDACKQIVTKQLKPLFDTISPTDVEYHSRMIVEISPALYVSHRITALEHVRRLPDTYREMAYWKICEFLFCKVSFGDPFDTSSGDGYDLTYEELVDVCDVLSLMERDESIYHFVNDIVDTVSHTRQNYTRPQKADIASRLKKIVDKKLPDSIGIQHEGYKIVSMTQIARLEQSSSGVWNNLVEKVRQIPNLADRAFSLGIIAESMPSKEGTKRAQLVQEAAQLVDQIPVAFERISHYEALARSVGGIGSAKRREFIRLAMQQAVTQGDPSLIPIQKRLIDFAHRIDPSFASSLASMADDDPARLHMNETLKNRIKMNDLKKKMLDPGVTDLGSLSSNIVDYSKAAWMCLGALNAQRIVPVHMNRVQELLRIASGLNISDSYPILAWAIENVIQRNSKTDQATRYLRPMFNATLLGAQLATAMALRSSTKLKLIRTRTLPKHEGESIIIGPGNRETALNWLSKWVETKVKNYLLICDPFIGPGDLEIAKIVQEAKPQCRISIITSKKHQDSEGIGKPWDQAYREHWRLHVSDQNPPDVDILIVGSRRTGELPIHDRWWLSDGDGIRLGTSFNSLGLKKESEISVFSAEETERAKEKLNEYLLCMKREHDGEKLDYFHFTL